MHVQNQPSCIKQCLFQQPIQIIKANRSTNVSNLNIHLEFKLQQNSLPHHTHSCGMCVHQRTLFNVNNLFDFFIANMCMMFNLSQSLNHSSFRLVETFTKMKILIVTSLHCQNVVQRTHTFCL